VNETEKAKQKSTSLSFYQALNNDKIMRRNFFIMLFIWICVSTSYYITNFILKYLKGDIFLNSSVSALSEVVSICVAGYIYIKLGVKKALSTAFILGFIGAAIIGVFQSQVESYIWVFVLLTRFGIGSAFGMIYLSNFIFPIAYAS